MHTQMAYRKVLTEAAGASVSGKSSPITNAIASKASSAHKINKTIDLMLLGLLITRLDKLALKQKYSIAIVTGIQNSGIIRNFISVSTDSLRFKMLIINIEIKLVAMRPTAVFPHLAREFLFLISNVNIKITSYYCVIRLI